MKNAQSVGCAEVTLCVTVDYRLVQFDFQEISNGYIYFWTYKRDFFFFLNKSLKRMNFCSRETFTCELCMWGKFDILLADLTWLEQSDFLQGQFCIWGTLDLFSLSFHLTLYICITVTKFNTNLLHYAICCWLVLQHVLVWLNRPSLGSPLWHMQRLLQLY